MKTTTISNIKTIILVGFVLTLCGVSTSLAWKGGIGDATLSALSPCTDKASAFPASLFTRLNKDRNGSISGFEVHISNTDGDCSVMLYASNAEESVIGLAGFQAGSDGDIAW